MKSKSPSFVYKSKQEHLLIESLAKSELISTQELLEIKELYHEHVPYHNFLHALKVAEGVLKLPRDTYNIIEIHSLFIAALFHDAGHSGTAEDLDEFRSLDMAFSGVMDFEKKYNYQGIDYSIIRKSIIGTVFKNRASNKDMYALILADLDVGTVGMELPEFLYYADFPFALECGVEILEWLEDLNFFKFLMSVDKNIFRSPYVGKIFPSGLRNIKEYISLDSRKIAKIFDFWKDKDISYDEFQTYFYKNM